MKIEIKDVPQADITDTALIADGWVDRYEETGGLILYEKAIPNRNELSDPEDSDIKLVIDTLRNDAHFAVALPSGALLYFTANSMTELKAFETALDYYDPEF